MKRLREWWKWRKVSKRKYPYKYNGPSQSFIEHGLPLRPLPGRKGSQGGRRWISADEQLVRLIHKEQVIKR